MASPTRYSYFKNYLFQYFIEGSQKKKKKKIIEVSKKKGEKENGKESKGKIR